MKIGSRLEQTALVSYLTKRFCRIRGGKSTLLLHPLTRKASVTKGINILIISHLMFSIAEGPLGAHRRAAAQHSQKCRIVGQVARLEPLQAPPCATVDSPAGGDGNDSPWGKRQIRVLHGLYLRLRRETLKSTLSGAGENWAPLLIIYT